MNHLCLSDQEQKTEVTERIAAVIRQCGLGGSNPIVPHSIGESSGAAVGMRAVGSGGQPDSSTSLQSSDRIDSPQKIVPPVFGSSGEAAQRGSEDDENEGAPQRRQEGKNENHADEDLRDCARSVLVIEIAGK